MNSKIAIPTVVAGTALALCLTLLAPGCSPEASTGPITGTGGVTTAGTGGSTVTGSGGGTATGSGGSTATGSGGSTTTGSGGSTATGSGGGTTTGSGGSTTTGTGGSTAAAPLCTTQVKGGPCVTPTDVCAKTCGPEKDGVKLGTKLETCTAAVYVEGACTFAAADYACFKVSATTAACPAGTMASMACTAAACTPCSGYADSGGAAKEGYCVCGTSGKWTCGSTKEWPCQAAGTSTSPGGTGC